MDTDSNYSQKQRELVKEIEQSLSQGSFNGSIVEMQTDYLNDDQICLSSVTFLPLATQPVITQKIIEPLRAIEPDHFYYSPETMHLTIKNIRTINNPPLFDKSDISKVDKLYTKLVPKFTRFSFDLEGVLRFPTSLSVMGYSGPELENLVRALDAGLTKIGVPDNKKYFSDKIVFGNVTFCRLTHQPGEKFIEAVKALRNTSFGSLPINDFNLITCNAVCAPKTLKIHGNYNLKTE